ncbi:hypothetical protein [Pandoravirus japonicus]|uniref:F-box domain containing protein n=1 Tax=Pandoravirus japonicus TaxID=2823154 RepID=A0A811BM64_9VIRU|nr:hypothetical protein [Pandoravirus japonicus]
MDTTGRARGPTAHVLVGLPIELWTLISRLCADDRDTRVALGAVCRTLRSVMSDLTSARVERARASIDVAVDAWERLSADADAAWSTGMDCPQCASAPNNAAGPIAKCTHLVRRYGPHRLGSVWRVCDNCAASAVRGLRERGLDHAAPVVVERVDLAVPHVWRTFHNFVPSHAVDDERFGVPAALAHHVNERAAVCLAALAALPPTYYFDDESTQLLPLPSARSWLPVGPAHVGRAYNSYYRGLFVCCDTAHPMWGAIAAARVGAGGRLIFNDQWIAYPHMGALMTNYRKQRHSMRRPDVISWVTGTSFEYDDAEGEIIR